jgi:hypothetical protein
MNIIFIGFCVGYIGADLFPKSFRCWQWWAFVSVIGLLFLFFS